MMDGLVSIITPSYNSGRFIRETIQSVQNQTYENLEMIIVDDCSTDNTKELLVKLQEKEQRLKVIELSENVGAAEARNIGLENAQGRYIAYLDADDLWSMDKLEKQLDFMGKYKVAFTCCDYEKIESDGTLLNKIIHMPKTITYDQLLSNTIIQTVGVVVDLKLVDKKLLIMPNVRRGQDSATWLQMLRNGVVFRGQNEVLAKYRRVSNSLSANKFSAIKRTWYLYRGVEKLSVFKSIRCLIGWAINASRKRIYRKG